MDRRLCWLSCAIVISLLPNCVSTAEKQTGSAEGAFSGERAFEHLVKQVSFGPRIPDSPGLRQTREYILAELGRNGFTTGTQPFSGRSALLERVVTGENLYGVYPPGKPIKYIISAHYDTRPVSDMAAAGPERNKPVPGANDGASGVAVLLELARTIPQSQPTAGVALVFFDLEDHGKSNDSSGFCMGSRYMATHLPAPLQGFQGGINLDMVGDKDLHLPLEGYSMGKAPELAKTFWDLGYQLHPTVFGRTAGQPIFDDHVPFQEAGYPYIDVIDFTYPAWHTPEDTADKCSGVSLRAVGETVLEFLKREK